MIISCLLELQVWLKCLWGRRRIWNLYIRLSIVQEENNHVCVTNASGSYSSGGMIIVNMYLNIIVLNVHVTFESVDEILWSDHSNESYWVVLSCGTVCFAVQGGSDFWVCGWFPIVCPLKWKLLSSTFLWYSVIYCLSWF